MKNKINEIDIPHIACRCLLMEINLNYCSLLIMNDILWFYAANKVVGRMGWGRRG